MLPNETLRSSSCWLSCRRGTSWKQLPIKLHISAACRETHLPTRLLSHMHKIESSEAEAKGTFPSCRLVTFLRQKSLPQNTMYSPPAGKTTQASLQTVVCRLAFYYPNSCDGFVCVGLLCPCQDMVQHTWWTAGPAAWDPHHFSSLATNLLFTFVSTPDLFQKCTLLPTSPDPRSAYWALIA